MPSSSAIFKLIQSSCVLASFQNHSVCPQMQNSSHLHMSVLGIEALFASICRLHTLCMSLTEVVVSEIPTKEASQSACTRSANLHTLSSSLEMLSLLHCTQISDFRHLLQHACPEKRFICQYAILSNLSTFHSPTSILPLLIDW